MHQICIALIAGLSTVEQFVVIICLEYFYFCLARLLNEFLGVTEQAFLKTFSFDYEY